MKDQTKFSTRFSEQNMFDDPDSFWDELPSFVEAKIVIPIIGTELAIVECQGRIEPYQQLLARQLALRLKLPSDLAHNNPSE